MLEQGGANEVYLSLRDADGAVLGEELTPRAHHAASSA